MTGALQIELEASRADGEPRTVRVAAPEDLPTGEFLDRLAEHLGLTGAAGAIQARSLRNGMWVDRTLTLADLGLMRGERLSLVVGRAPGGTTGRLADRSLNRAVDAQGRVGINRPPRALRSEPEGSVVVPAKRTHRPPRRFPLGAILLPLIVGLILVAVIRRWEILLFTLITPLMAAWNWLEERRARADELREYGRTYEQEVELTFAEVGRISAAWERWLHAHHPSPEELIAATRNLDARVWQRQPSDGDFLMIRLGLGERSAPVTIRRDGRSLAARLDDPDLESACRVDGVPVTVDLAAGGLALLGDQAAVAGAVRWLAAQVAAWHSPADVQLVGLVADRDLREWLRWLPHASSARWGAAAVTGDRAEANALIDQVLALAERRESERRPQQTADSTQVVVLVDGSLDLSPAQLSALVAAADSGVIVVWYGGNERAVPPGLAQLARVGADSIEVTVLTGATTLRCAPDRLRLADCLDVAAALAPVFDASDFRTARTIPERVSLEDLIPDLVQTKAIRTRWQQASPHALIATLGVEDSGPLEIDLGPGGSHALIGGTTGSGKSELLQTMVASLAAVYPPDRVGFLLVDYKGGAAFKDARHLPHCVGVVTDLDDHLSARVMIALDAEIKRREHLLAEAGARDLSELRRFGKAAPADLLIVVDEFATLAKELPAFVEGVVDIAARGRSLGLRLVLATQRPAGVINDRIRANVGLRIALRVNDEADSQDIIDDRAAAHIPRTLPGRAYIKVHRELVEFQSAFVGGPPKATNAANVEITDLWSARPSSRSAAATSTTVLAEVVGAAARLMRSGTWQTPHVPWLPALPGLITRADLARLAPADETGTVIWGLADLPHRQTQQVTPYVIDHHQSMLVFGTSRSGKTTFLRSIASGFIATHSPDFVRLVGLDFAGHGLRVLQDAPHTVAITGLGEMGRLARTIRWLDETIRARKAAMARAQAGGFVEYAAASADPVPRVLVLIDGFAGAMTGLERVDNGRLLEQLLQIIRDGPSAGVYFALTVDRRAAVPGSLSSIITTRIVLRMAERDDYALVGVQPAAVPVTAPTPGRCIVGGRTEVQVAVCAGAEPAVEERAIADLVEQARTRRPGPVFRVGQLPTEVPSSALGVGARPFLLPMGVGDARLEELALDLAEGHALIAGPPRSGKSSALALAAWAAARQGGVDVVLVTARRTPVRDLGIDWVMPPIDALNPDELRQGVRAIEERLAEGRSVLCVVDDGDCLPDAASTALEELAKSGRDRLLRILVACDNRWAARVYGGLVAEVKRGKQGIVLAPDFELDGDLIGVRLRPPVEDSHVPGRGVLGRQGLFELIQLARLPGT